MPETFLLIGGNMGNRYKNLETARNSISKKAGQIIKSSSIYETAAWGITDQPNFLNQVLLIDTMLQPDALLDIILEIEISIGRKRTIKFGPRSIDIDILFYDRAIYQTDRLVIPHPELQNRKFVLIPLNEIASHFIHPVLQKSIYELLQECGDDLVVKKYNC